MFLFSQKRGSATACQTAPFSSTSYHAIERTEFSSRKVRPRGGGLCVYINDAWCRDAVVVCKHCSPLVEFMIIKCRPFYLPREYTAIMLAAVYIPPNSNNNRSEALNELYQHISEQQTAHPDAFLILAGDFNHADLKSVFPKIHQHVDFPTRETTLWTLFTPPREELTRPYPSPILAPQTISLSC